jgi:hypothetical protein
MITAEILNTDRLTSSAQQALQQAQYYAAQMEAQEVYPEHLLLGVLAQGDSKVAKALSTLGMNIRVLRAQAADIFGGSVPVEPAQGSLSLSQEAQACLDWAMAFAEQQDISSLSSAHILLGTVRHQRVQPLLALLLSSTEILPTYLAETDGAAYTRAMDQLIRARLGRLGSDNDALAHVGIRVERPTITFADIAGAEPTKQALGDLITYLSRPQLTQGVSGNSPYDGLPHGTLLVGHPCTERTLLVHATAGEAVVPLISLSLAALADVLGGASTSEAVQEGRGMIQQAFARAKGIAPSLLFFDDLDALERLDAKDARRQLLNQLLVELDELDRRPPLIVVATTYLPDALEPALVSPGRFDRRVHASGSFSVHPASQTKLCLSCKRELLAHWKHCIYCGASVLQACPTCGAPHIEVAGAGYCFECGSARWSA